MDRLMFIDPALPYPLRIVKTPQGLFRVYDIPEEKKGEVLVQLFPGMFPPGMEEEMEDIHSGKTFVVRDFIVTREGGMNVLASPFYFEAGGTVIDWWPLGEGVEDDAAGGR
jgi:hypothetical protein